MTMTSKHPYYPLDLKLSGDYVENDWSVSFLITAFGALWMVLLGATLVAVRRVNHRLSAVDQGLVLWFVLSKSPPLEWLWPSLTVW
jgi:3-deoxy-D-manno-octulosonic-acid transferase